MFYRPDSCRHYSGNDLSPGTGGGGFRGHTGDRQYGGFVEDVHSQHSHLHKRNGVISVPYCIFLWIVPVNCQRYQQKDADKNRNRSGIYLRGTCAFPYGRERRLYAGGKLSGPDPCGTSLCMDYCPHWYDYRLFYRSCGAGGVCPHKAGGGNDVRSHLGKGNGNQPFRGRVAIRGDCHAQSSYRHFRYVVSGARLCGGAYTDIFRSENIYGNCL